MTVTVDPGKKRLIVTLNEKNRQLLSQREELVAQSSDGSFIVVVKPE